MKDYFLPLLDRREIAEETMAFWFDRSGTDLTFNPGQNADFTALNLPENLLVKERMHTFSIASSPNDRDSIMICTRMRSSPFKNRLKSMPLGTKIQVTQPSGHMTLHDDPSVPAVFIAGGIGITPFRSMIKWATEEKLQHRITLLYSNRTVASAAFLDDLKTWEATNHQLRLVLTITEEQDHSWPYEHGRIDEAFLQRHVPEFSHSRFYLAGPPALVTAMRSLVLGLGVDRSNVVLESFTGYT